MQQLGALPPALPATKKQKKELEAPQAVPTPPSPSQPARPGVPPEAVALASKEKKKKSVRFAVRWPGEQLDDWCDATRTALTPAAATLVQAVLMRFDADKDGVLNSTELNALNNGTGSGEIDSDALDFLLQGNFHTKAGGLSARGLDQYFIYSLKADLSSTLTDLKNLGLHNA